MCIIPLFLGNWVAVIIRKLREDKKAGLKYKNSASDEALFLVVFLHTLYAAFHDQHTQKRGAEHASFLNFCVELEF